MRRCDAELGIGAVGRSEVDVQPAKPERAVLHATLARNRGDRKRSDEPGDEFRDPTMDAVARNELPLAKGLIGRPARARTFAQAQGLATMPSTYSRMRRPARLPTPPCAASRTRVCGP